MAWPTADAGCLIYTVNDFPATAAGIVNVHAVAGVSVAIITVELLMSSVCADPAAAIVCTPSVYPLIVGSP